MTNEEAKQEAIKKAYGEHWDMVKNFPISEDGRVKLKHTNPILGKIKLECLNLASRDEAWYCPESIINLESNNGWIRIEPDGSNLPTEKDEYRVILKSGNMVDLYFDPKEDLSFKPFATHYKPIIPELKPIY